MAQRRGGILMKKIILIGAVITLLPAAARGRDFGIDDPVKKKGDITYMCTGVGESKDDPRTASFPMKIVFATDSSVLYSDVDVRITRESGEKVFELFCDGAWLLVQLPPGTYTVTATDKRKITRSCSMKIGSGQSMSTLRWPD
jgi:hypothetical protein